MRPGLSLHKHHGLGNDFLIALVDELPAAPAAAETAVRLCHRRRGVGADGLIFATGGSDGSEGSAVMRLWNSDGSAAEVSGNGLRCLAHAIARRRGVDRLDIVVDTVAGPRRCSIRPGPGPATVTGTVEMGDPGPGPRPDGASADPGAVVGDLAGAGGVERWDTVDMGNPHIVLAVADPGAVPLDRAGPAVEALFEGGINVHFAALTGDDEVTMSVWERGAEATEACGTGAVAAAAVYRRWGLVGHNVTLRMSGGDALVDLSAPVTLTGPSVHIATVVLEDG